MSELYLGLISGTSADAIDAALVRFEPAPRVVAAESSAYPAALRPRVLELSQRRDPVPLPDFAVLDVMLGRAFAAAANALLARAGVDRRDVRAIGSHGQTLLHAPRGDAPYTLQAGDPNVIAEETGITTVADFRRRDVAAGGEGAPLMPAFHAAFLSDPRETRAALNLGGIANITTLADGGAAGFDTGPAIALLDAWSLRHRGEAHDARGAWARSGRVDASLLARCLEDSNFALPAPKSTGRDHFNLDWLERHGGAALARLAPEDVQATLAELTATSVAHAVRAAAPDAARVVACGGGVHNAYLMERLAAALAPVPLETTDDHGVPADFVEAIGFAWLAKQTLAGAAGNLPSVTGARGPRVLGGIYPG